jgi:hypothetical protein
MSVLTKWLAVLALGVGFAAFSDPLPFWRHAGAWMCALVAGGLVFKEERAK